MKHKTNPSVLVAMGNMLSEINPQAHQACINAFTPVISDLNLMPAIFDIITRDHEPNPENSAFVVAVMYKLYGPFKLHLRNSRMSNGFRPALCALMGWKDGPIVNHYSDNAIAYYKGKNWRERVDSMAMEIKIMLSELPE